MEFSCKLYDFKADDTLIKGNDSDSDEDANKPNFCIQLFGIDTHGKTYCIWVNDFSPFFYVKIPEHWKKQQIGYFVQEIIKKTNIGIQDIVGIKPVSKKKLYGFDGNKNHRFVELKFINLMTFYKVRKLWYKEINKGDEKEKILLPNGYYYKGEKLYLYESDIPPLLKFFHIRNISPSGWISIPKKQLHSCDKTTSCVFEYQTSYKNISPLSIETQVPYKIVSYDIEADSSHGDFPVPIKKYDKLTSNLIDIYEKENYDEFQEIKTLLCRGILTAFDYDNLKSIDKVYPFNNPSKDHIKRQIELILNYDFTKQDIRQINSQSIVNVFNKIEQDDDLTEETVKINIKKIKDEKINIIDYMLNNDISKSDKSLMLLSILNKFLPKLKGDIVTFIGSTFRLYGQEKPYLNHIIVLNGCNDIPEIDNCVVETYDTEEKVLLAWTNLIKREDPQFIIGYNIFGFDYPFMIDRAQENYCEDEFLYLSCDEDKKSQVKESSIILASGQHDIKYIEMNGRIQVDLYNHFRKDFNLESYKLDYVSGYFMSGEIKKYNYDESTNTTVFNTQNTIGLELHSYIHIEECGHSNEYYKQGAKFKITSIDKENNIFHVEGKETPDADKYLKWCLAKDDVGPKDIFRLSKGSDSDRAIVAKYCIQDCNLVHELFKKIDIMTGFIEMAKICSVPINFLVLRGQGIKLTSFISKKCMEKNTLMPTIQKKKTDDGYEGAIVLPPKCDLYMEDPVACVDYSSLYPSSMISENLCHSSKVWTKEYDLENNLIKETGETDENGEYIYDNLPKYKYVDVTYDTFKYHRKTPTAAAIKVKIGHKICRFAQYPNGKAVMPSVLEELLLSRKATKKQAAKETDPFMKNILDKRQLSIKLTANSLYGGTGAKTSSFYEKDVAASTTATGRKLLIYAQRIIEDVYGNTICESKKYGKVRSKAKYIYGDTDSVFFCFYFEELDGTPIKNKKALELTIELAQEAGELATKFLKNPHDLEYEKTFWPFCLLSKKRYTGMLYELNPEKCKRKSMGIVLKRRDNAPIVKDVYGGIIDILMKERSIEKSIEFLKNILQTIVEGKIPIDKLVITKSLRGNYKNPLQIAHKVLADRMGERDPGNKPGPGDRIPFAYFINKEKKCLQGDKIESPTFIIENNLQLDYAHYITNQIMKPVQQIYALVLHKIPEFNRKKLKKIRFYKELESYKKTMESEKAEKKIEQIKNKTVKELLFDDSIQKCSKSKNNLSNYFDII
tara:strand:- start:10733 stop:14452 length:3720 start_codon:yes stop_codon:yes gene_type:complete